MRLTQRNTVCCLYFMSELKNPNKTDLQVCEAISLLTMCVKLCCSRKYPYSPHKGFFWFEPPAPLEIPLKVLTFEDPPPSPSEFPMTLCGGGTDIFWNHTFCLRVCGKRKVLAFLVSRMFRLDPEFRFKMMEIKVTKNNTRLH